MWEGTILIFYYSMSLCFPGLKRFYSFVLVKGFWITVTWPEQGSDFLVLLLISFCMSAQWHVYSRCWGPYCSVLCVLHEDHLPICVSLCASARVLCVPECVYALSTMPSRHCRGRKHTRAALNIVASYHSNGMVIRLSSQRQ